MEHYKSITPSDIDGWANEPNSAAALSGDDGRHASMPSNAGVVMNLPQPANQQQESPQTAAQDLHSMQTGPLPARRPRGKFGNPTTIEAAGSLAMNFRRHSHLASPIAIASNRKHKLATSGIPSPASAMNVEEAAGEGEDEALSPPFEDDGGRLYQMPPVNSADMNPPCNTLYVGNLPLDPSEEELKTIFIRQRGYKRFCFRTTQNEPMCLVEFEDTSYAVNALRALYGRMLSNSVKGGIRPSFSKNPLGVRSDTDDENPDSAPAQGVREASELNEEGAPLPSSSAQGSARLTPLTRENLEPYGRGPVRGFFGSSLNSSAGANVETSDNDGEVDEAQPEEHDSSQYESAEEEQFEEDVSDEEDNFQEDLSAEEENLQEDDSDEEMPALIHVVEVAQPLEHAFAEVDAKDGSAETEPPQVIQPNEKVLAEDESSSHHPGSAPVPPNTPKEDDEWEKPDDKKTIQGQAEFILNVDQKLRDYQSPSPGPEAASSVEGMDSSYEIDSNNHVRRKDSHPENEFKGWEKTHPDLPPESDEEPDESDEQAASSKAEDSPSKHPAAIPLPPSPVPEQSPEDAAQVDSMLDESSAIQTIGVQYSAADDAELWDTATDDGTRDRPGDRNDKADGGDDKGTGEHEVEDKNNEDHEPAAFKSVPVGAAHIVRPAKCSGKNPSVLNQDMALPAGVSDSPNTVPISPPAPQTLISNAQAATAVSLAPMPFGLRTKPADISPQRIISADDAARYAGLNERHPPLRATSHGPNANTQGSPAVDAPQRERSYHIVPMRKGYKSNACNEARNESILSNERAEQFRKLQARLGIREPQTQSPAIAPEAPEGSPSTAPAEASEASHENQDASEAITLSNEQFESHRARQAEVQRIAQREIDLLRGTLVETDGGDPTSLEAPQTRSPDVAHEAPESTPSTAPAEATGTASQSPTEAFHENQDASEAIKEPNEPASAEQSSVPAPGSNGLTPLRIPQMGGQLIPPAGEASQNSSPSSQEPSPSQISNTNSTRDGSMRISPTPHNDAAAALIEATEAPIRPNAQSSLGRQGGFEAIIAIEGRVIRYPPPPNHPHSELNFDPVPDLPGAVDATVQPDTGASPESPGAMEALTEGFDKLTLASHGPESNALNSNQYDFLVSRMTPETRARMAQLPPEKLQELKAKWNSSSTPTSSSPQPETVASASVGESQTPAQTSQDERVGPETDALENNQDNLSRGITPEQRARIATLFPEGASSRIKTLKSPQVEKLASTSVGESQAPAQTSQDERVHSPTPTDSIPVSDERIRAPPHVESPEPPQPRPVSKHTLRVAAWRVAQDSLTLGSLTATAMMQTYNSERVRSARGSIGEGARSLAGEVGSIYRGESAVSDRLAQGLLASLAAGVAVADAVSSPQGRRSIAQAIGVGSTPSLQTPIPVIHRVMPEPDLGIDAHLVTRERCDDEADGHETGESWEMVEANAYGAGA